MVNRTPERWILGVRDNKCRRRLPQNCCFRLKSKNAYGYRETGCWLDKAMCMQRRSYFDEIVGWGIRTRSSCTVVDERYRGHWIKFSLMGQERNVRFLLLAQFLAAETSRSLLDFRKTVAIFISP